MKKILTTIFILGFSLSPIHAEDYETTHTFAAGDVISAEMMNEVFSRIKESESTIKMSDIVGTWQCNSLANVATSSCVGDWNSGVNSLYYYLDGLLTIVDDEDGTYSYSTSTPSVLRCNISTANTGSLAIKNNIMFFSEPAIQLYPKLSSTRFTASLPPLSGFVNPYTMSLECDKQATPPKNPTVFAVATTNLSNVLTWTDNSSDETGFKVYKKSSATGSWVLIDAGAGLTVNSNIATYTDTVSTAGDYWYRVKANNINNGDSVGSKVIKVTNTI